ncbi:MAG: hypothetical protein ACLURP_03660 [Ruminococcus sp.]
MKKGKKTRWLYKAAGMAVLLGAAFWCSNSGLLLWKPEVLTVLAESVKWRQPVICYRGS